MIGKILGGRYQILERIGGGGMAIVYRGLDVLLHRAVSVKTLRPEYVGDAEFVRRFKREAQAAASLSNPSVVNIYDVGQDGEAHYIVMEYVDGKTLKQIIEERAPLPVDEAVAITRQICDALTHAHEHNIIHRDVKPHNILISKTGRVKVTDFGIARAISANTITHHSSSVLGSVHYFSPEQARGNVADAKSDVYSLGVVLYEMLTGQLPFSGETAISVALKHLQEPFVEPRSLAPRIPQSVENIVLRALMKDPRERYQSVAQMANDLEQALMLPDVPKFISPMRASQDSPTIQIPHFVLDSMQEPETEEEILDEEAVPRPWWKKILILLAWFVGLIILAGLAALAAFYIFVTFMKPQTKELPSVVGMPYAQARAALIRAGFSANKISEATDTTSSSPVAIGQVEAQNPARGNVMVDTGITLTVKEGSAEAQMPNLSGMTLSAANARLSALLVPSGNISTTEQQSAIYPVNQVISTFPSSGTQFNVANTPITLVISSGTQSAAVPDVQGQSLQKATSVLKADGFVIGKTTKESSFTTPVNQVISQSPSPGQQVTAGTAVDLTVSSGQPAGTTETIVNVDVSLPPGTSLPALIKMVVTDVSGVTTAVNSSQTTPSATYPVRVTTTPTQSGQINVYENDQLVQSLTVNNNGTVNSASFNTSPPPGGSGTGTTAPSGSGTGTTAPGGSGTGTTAPGSSGTGTTPSGSSTTPAN